MILGFINEDTRDVWEGEEVRDWLGLEPEIICMIIANSDPQSQRQCRCACRRLRELADSQVTTLQITTDVVMQFSRRRQPLHCLFPALVHIDISFACLSSSIAQSAASSGQIYSTIVQPESAATFNAGTSTATAPVALHAVAVSSLVSTDSQPAHDASREHGMFAESQHVVRPTAAAQGAGCLERQAESGDTISAPIALRPCDALTLHASVLDSSDFELPSSPVQLLQALLQGSLPHLPYLQLLHCERAQPSVLPVGVAAPGDSGQLAWLPALLLSAALPYLWSLSLPVDPLLPASDTATRDDSPRAGEANQATTWGDAPASSTAPAAAFDALALLLDSLSPAPCDGCPASGSSSEVRGEAAGWCSVWPELALHGLLWRSEQCGMLVTRLAPWVTSMELALPATHHSTDLVRALEQLPCLRQLQLMLRWGANSTADLPDALHATLPHLTALTRLALHNDCSYRICGLETLSALSLLPSLQHLTLSSRDVHVPLTAAHLPVLRDGFAALTHLTVDRVELGSASVISVTQLRSLDIALSARSAERLALVFPGVEVLRLRWLWEQAMRKIGGWRSVTSLRLANLTYCEDWGLLRTLSNIQSLALARSSSMSLLLQLAQLAAALPYLRHLSLECWTGGTLQDSCCWASPPPVSIVSSQDTPLQFGALDLSSHGSCGASGGTSEAAEPLASTLILGTPRSIGDRAEQRSSPPSKTRCGATCNHQGAAQALAQLLQLRSLNLVDVWAPLASAILSQPPPALAALTLARLPHFEAHQLSTTLQRLPSLTELVVVQCPGLAAGTLAALSDLHARPTLVVTRRDSMAPVGEEWW